MFDRWFLLCTTKLNTLHSNFECSRVVQCDYLNTELYISISFSLIDSFLSFFLIISLFLSIYPKWMLLLVYVSIFHEPNSSNSTIYFYSCSFAHYYACDSILLMVSFQSKYYVAVLFLWLLIWVILTCVICIYIYMCFGSSLPAHWRFFDSWSDKLYRFQAPICTIHSMYVMFSVCWKWCLKSFVFYNFSFSLQCFFFSVH